MKVFKVYNNNVVHVIDNNDDEGIVIGLGIGFQKKVGEKVDRNAIKKFFSLQNNQQSQLFTQLLAEISIDYFEISEQILSYAESKLHSKLNLAVHISLADHISFAIERYNKGIVLKNPLMLDIKNMYPIEFEVGLFALNIIRKKFGVILPESEGGTIAMHIINGSMANESNDVSRIVDFVADINRILKYRTKLILDEDSLNYRRFVTHIRFFAQRVLNGEPLNNDISEYHNLLVPSKLTQLAVDLIVEYVQLNYDYDVSDEERFYLAIHIERLLKN